MNRSRIKQVGVSIAVITVVVGGVTEAHAVTTSKKLHACASKRTGALRLATHCKHSEKAVVWNQTGAAGPQGKAGAPGHQGIQGVQGIQGKQGVPGVNGSASVASYSNSSHDTNSRPVVTEGTADIVVGSLTLPAGSFSVNAFASFYDTILDPDLSCRLRAPVHGTGLYYSPTAGATLFGVTQGTFVNLSVSTVVTAPAGGSLDLVCTTQVADPTHPPTTNEWDITATSVDSVNGSSTPIEGFE